MGEEALSLIIGPRKVDPLRQRCRRDAAQKPCDPLTEWPSML